MKKAVMLMGVLSLACGNAMAADSGWYLGFNVGNSKLKDQSQDEYDAAALDAFNSAGFTVLSAESDLDDKDTAWSLLVGYKFLPYLAVEGGYADLGSLVYSAQGTVRRFGVNSPAAVNTAVSVKGAQLAAVGILPLGARFDIHGRLGILFAKTDVDAVVTIGNTIGTDGVSANSQDAFFGLGASFHFNDHFALNVDWHQYQDVGDPDETGEGDVQTTTLGLTFSF